MCENSDFEYKEKCIEKASPENKLLELTFTKEEFEKSSFYDDPDASFWIFRGKPIVWIEEYNKDGVQAYSDIGYGYLKLIVNEEKVIDYSGHCVYNNGYVMLSSYYIDECEGKVFKCIN